MSNKTAAFVAMVFAFLLMSSNVFAQDAEEKTPAAEKEKIVEAYAAPDYRELIQSMVVLGGYDINDTRVADAYGELLYCDLYTKYFSNDFEWNNVRRNIVNRVLQKKEMYRVQYEYQGLVKLDRYSFEKQVFPLSAQTRMSNVGSLQLVSETEARQVPCIQQKEKYSLFFPLSIYLRFPRPINLTELKLPPDEAEILLNKLKAMRIADRSLHVRYRFRVVDVPRINTDSEETRGQQGIGQINAQMQAADFYLDRDLTMKVASVEFD